MDRVEIQSRPPSLSPGIPHPQRGRKRAPELNEGSLKHENKHCPKHTQQSIAVHTKSPETALQTLTRPTIENERRRPANQATRHLDL